MLSMTVTVLEELKSYYKENILSQFKLRKPNDKDVNEYIEVTPACHIGIIPPKEIIDKLDNVNIPCIVIGVDKKTSSDEKTSFGLRISVAIYEPKIDDGINTLLNVMDRIEADTLKNQVIAGKYKLSSIIESAIYDEQMYPYWYGYLKFTITTQAYPVTRYANFM